MNFHNDYFFEPESWKDLNAEKPNVSLYKYDLRDYPKTFEYLSQNPSLLKFAESNFPKSREEIISTFKLLSHSFNAIPEGQTKLNCNKRMNVLWCLNLDKIHTKDKNKTKLKDIELND